MCSLGETHDTTVEITGGLHEGDRVGQHRRRAAARHGIGVVMQGFTRALFSSAPSS